MILLNLCFLYIYNLYIFSAFFVVGILLCLIFKVILDQIWVVTEINYEDIFKPPLKKHVSFDAIVFTFAIGFSLLFEFSFFLFAINSLFFSYWIFCYWFLQTKNPCTTNQLVVSLLIGGTLSFYLFWMYLQRRNEQTQKE